MVTIFSIPKAFNGHIGTIQWNAVNSWMKLGQDCQVVLCGDDAGVAEAAREVGAEYIPDIDRNEFGTPLLSSAFKKTRKIARHRLLCFVNADIILFKDFIEGLKKITLPNFLAVGQRWDMDVTQRINFKNKRWDTRLRDAVEDQGKLHGAYGSDYFVFPKNSKLLEIPPFAVGRPGWDCWFIYRARKLRMPVVDASKTIFIVHQNHDYSHVKKESAFTADGRRWYGPEKDLHMKLMGSKDTYFTPLDATHLLGQDGLKRALDYPHLKKQWRRLRILYPEFGRLFNFIDQVENKIKNKKIVQNFLS